VLAGLGLLRNGRAGRRPLDETKPVVPIAEDRALAMGKLCYHRHLH
jgi:hypothetical protein